MSRLRRLAEAVEERTGVRSLWRALADERIRGGARWAYVFGSVLFVLLVGQGLTGLSLAMSYAPTTDAAWDSVARLMDPEQAPWGALVRGLHHHGASFMVVLLVVHVLQVAFFGAHRKPREANWLTGLALGLVVFAFAFTGYLLPWDQTAYYATRVGLNIMRSVPVVGPVQAQLLQGGDVLGNLTLTRFYALHVVVLPAAAALLAALHLLLFRRHGVTPGARHDAAELERRTHRFWPAQLLRDVVASVVVYGALLAVAALVPAPLGERADPSVPFDARPEWYFYWLFQLLHWFEPPVEWIGTLVIPVGLVAFFALLPWLDRSPERDWRRRRAPLFALVGVLAGIGALTLQVVVEVRAEEGEGGEAATLAAGPSESDEAPSAQLVGERAVKAGMLYGMHCTECHGLAGEPIDPDATDFRTADFRTMATTDFQHLVDYVMEGGEMMPSFDDELSEEQARLILHEIVVKFSEDDSAVAGAAGVE